MCLVREFRRIFSIIGEVSGNFSWHIILEADSIKLYQKENLLMDVLHGKVCSHVDL
jgi:hypothetical protein